MINYYKTPKKSIDKYFKKSTSYTNEVGYTKKEKKDMRTRQAMIHNRHKVIEKCKSCTYNSQGFCIWNNRWCNVCNAKCKIK